MLHFTHALKQTGRWGSSVSIVTRLQIKRLRYRTTMPACFLRGVQTASVSNPSLQLGGYRGSYPQVMKPTTHLLYCRC
jgi:hypothetical protein